MRTVTCHSFGPGKTVEYFESGSLVLTFSGMTPEEADDSIWLWLVDGILPFDPAAMREAELACFPFDR